MAKRTHLFLTISILMFTVIGSSVWFMNPPIVTKGDTFVTSTTTTQTPSEALPKFIVIHLDQMTLDFHEGNTVIETLPLLSQGRPGSYYETIGGSYINDYKTPLHFSSIGHVYMPYSVHLFGNYFIHGIPYYPDGRPVSSTYSGGCIRLTNENAKKVFDFIGKGTRIIVTRGSETDFVQTPYSTSTFVSQEMTNLMVAAVSLETLTQDNVITDTDGITNTTRKTILPRLIQQGDTEVAKLYAQSIGNTVFVGIMNKKAESLGLTNTHFDSVESPVITTYNDYERFMTYITTYKSYLRTIQSSARN